tara:strand:+ start:290 stop:538 length:249 start_codon:yes stop_codon:yes gene_type:complete
MGEVTFMMTQPNIWTTAKFSRMIEKLSVELNAPVMDTVVHYCERNKMEIESAAKLCNSKLKKQMFADALTVNMVKAPDVETD